MLILALDTTTRARQRRAVRRRRVLACVTGDASRTHGERLPGELLRSLDRRRRPRRDRPARRRQRSWRVHRPAHRPRRDPGPGARARAAGRRRVRARRARPAAPADAGAPVEIVVAWLDARARRSVRGAVPAAPARHRSAAERLVERCRQLMPPADTSRRWRPGRPRRVHVCRRRRGEAIATLIAQRSPDARSCAAGAARRGATIAGSAARRQSGDAMAAARAPADLRPASRRRDRSAARRSRRHEPRASNALVVVRRSRRRDCDRGGVLHQSEDAGDVSGGAAEPGRLSYLRWRATADCRVVGFCAFWQVVDELHINNLAVLPELRAAGIGTALLDRVLDEAARLGAPRATLEVRASNGRRGCCTSGGVLASRASARAITQSRSRTRLMLWRDAAWLEHARGLILASRAMGSLRPDNLPDSGKEAEA